ncbi:uncharacterized protein LOC114351058 [Ostrinia furnacalis]|uniref:uncharacterized protein LOC114351058 n=1 Tax=Ostrinia furnacalis TaxID=93504 RepID=UPI00103C1263|nr:uncharacterized protein LOC114351058 [Ostrinia furnacalis]
MIFFRLIVWRIIVYLELDRPTKEQARLDLLMKRKPKPFKTKLIINETMNMYVSVMLSLVVFLLGLSIPFHALDDPCEGLRIGGYLLSYKIALVIEPYTGALDYFIVVFSIMLVYISIKTVLDAIKHTTINISPWLERGKYTLPPKRRKSFIINISRGKY